MKLTLSEWASMAEVASGVAVVVTLIFLISEVRENTAATLAAAYDRNIDSLNAQRIEVVKDPEVARLWHAFETGQTRELNDLDWMRLSFLINITYGNYEKAYFSQRYGVLGSSEWDRYVKQICINRDRLLAAPKLRDALNLRLTEEFIEFIDVSCANGSHE